MEQRCRLAPLIGYNSASAWEGAGLRKFNGADPLSNGYGTIPDQTRSWKDSKLVESQALQPRSCFALRNP